MSPYPIILSRASPWEQQKGLAVVYIWSDLTCRLFSLQEMTQSSSESACKCSLFNNLLNNKSSSIPFWWYPTNVGCNGNLTQGIFFKIYIQCGIKTTTDLILITLRSPMSFVMRHRASRYCWISQRSSLHVGLARAAAAFSWQPDPRSAGRGGGAVAASPFPSSALFPSSIQVLNSKTSCSTQHSGKDQKLCWLLCSL